MRRMRWGTICVETWRMANIYKVEDRIGMYNVPDGLFVCREHERTYQKRIDSTSPRDGALELYTDGCTTCHRP